MLIQWPLRTVGKTPPPPPPPPKPWWRRLRREPEPPPLPPPPPPKPWLKQPKGLAVIGVLVVAVLLLCGELGLRAWAEGKIEDGMRRSFHAKSVQVSLGPTPLLLELATGGIDKVEVTARDGSIEQIRGVDLTAVLYDVAASGDDTTISRSAVTITFGKRSSADLVARVFHLDPASPQANRAADLLLRLGSEPAGGGLAPRIEGRAITIDGQLPGLGGGQAKGRLDFSDLPLGLTPKELRVRPGGLTLTLSGGRATLPRDGAR